MTLKLRLAIVGRAYAEVEFWIAYKSSILRMSVGAFGGRMGAQVAQKWGFLKIMPCSLCSR